VVFLGCGVLAFGQATNSGDITGTVTDPTGAVLPAVAITVLDVDKNDTHTFTTNDAGFYDTGSLIPDHYLLTYVKTGFETLKRGPITLSVGVTAINVQLTVGQESQQIVVTSEVPLLETSSSEISTTIESETLTELPQTGGFAPDWSNFIILSPGTTGTGQSFFGGSTNPGTSSSANGSLPYLTGLMDGAYVTSPMSDNLIEDPIFDGIAEVKTSNNLYSAQGGLGGVLYNQITKGGSDHFHGMAYDYIQNNIANAAAFGFGQPSPVPVVHINVFGGNIGGFLPLPVVHKRLFLFYGMERTIYHGGGSYSNINVPDDKMRTGDFTEPGMPVLYDPTTTKVDPTTGYVTRKSFMSENNDGLNKIESGLDPVAQNMNKWFPEPTAAQTNGIPSNNYRYLAQGFDWPQVKYLGRFDYDINDKNRLTGSSSWNNGWPPGSGPNCPIDCGNTDVLSSLSQLTDVWTINSKMVNEFRMGFMMEHDTWIPQNLGKGYPAAIGLKFSKADEIPVITFGGSQEYGFDPTPNGYYISNVLTPSEVFSVVLGRHDIHLGGEFLIYRSDSTQGNLNNWGTVDPANMSFSGVYTQGSTDPSSPLTTSTGAAYADFLLGYANSWSALLAPEFGAREKIPQLFAQDDWKFNQNLTLNLGVRWAGTTGWSDIKGNVLSFDPTITNPATHALGAMWYGTTHANGRTHLDEPTWKEFMPRVGFAYQIGEKTTIRGGWGIYTYPWSWDDYGQGFGLAIASSGSEPDTTGGAYPVVQLDETGNVAHGGNKAINDVWSTSAPNAPDSYNGQDVSYQKYDNPFVQLQQWNITVQRQINANLMGQIGYVGSHGANMLYKTDINQVPESKLGPTDASDRPYPFGTISGNTPNGISNYHSLQAIITQRTKAGLFFTFNYTWSKFLDDQDTAGWNDVQGNENYQNGYDPESNYGPSNFDVRQMLKGQIVYQLPFGKGRQFLNHNPVLDEAIGGWEITGTMILQTGGPFTVSVPENRSYAQSDNGQSQYPNLVGNPFGAGSKTWQNWYNVSALADPGAGVFGNMRRNTLFGPDLKTANAALHKVFPVWENLKLDLSMSAQNVFNHPVLGLPFAYLAGADIFNFINSTAVGGRSMEFVVKLKF
jgi:hypothetical protein